MTAIKEIEDAILSIEQDIYDRVGEECYNLVLVSNGYCCRVEFLGIVLWNSDDDERECDAAGRYESLEWYLRKRIKEEITKLSKVKVL